MNRIWFVGSIDALICRDRCLDIFFFMQFHNWRHNLSHFRTTHSSRFQSHMLIILRVNINLSKKKNVPTKTTFSLKRTVKKKEINEKSWKRIPIDRLINWFREANRGKRLSSTESEIRYHYRHWFEVRQEYFFFFRRHVYLLASWIQWHNNERF